MAGTLDEGDQPSGLLLVSGGSEVRSGAFSWQARLAADISAQGFPVFRFDRRGIGDSTGTNRGFRESGEDIAAAFTAFRAQCPELHRIVGFGNCDAASALMLNGGAGCDALVLANPWTFEGEQEDALPPAAIRQRYAERLRNPREVLRLLRGGVNFRKLAGGLRQAVASPVLPAMLPGAMSQGLERSGGSYTVLLAGRDRTAQAFLAAWEKQDPHLRLRPDADHVFSAEQDHRWLREELLAALHEQAGQLNMR